MTVSAALKNSTETAQTRSAPGSLWPQLKTGLNAAPETYANVHRGSGHASLVTTHLYEAARQIVLDCLQLKSKKYTLIFASPGRGNRFAVELPSNRFFMVTGEEVGVSVGVCAIAVEKRFIPRGGTARTRRWDHPSDW